jgi:hypothetical protein
MTVSNKVKRRPIRPGLRGLLTRNCEGLSSEDSPATEVDATKRRTEITIETHRVMRITKPNGFAAGWCEECSNHVWMVSPEEAAVLGGVPTRLIYQWIEAHRLHLVERPHVPLVCLKSLEASIASHVEERRELQ